MGLLSPLCRTCSITCRLILIALCVSAPLLAQDVRIGVTYICSGEHITIDSCNIRDTSDTANCMVGHPDHIQPNGLMQYTYATRGALKKLLPTCTQPSQKQIAAADAFQKRQQDTYDANVKKANDQLDAINAQPLVGPPGGQPQKSKSADERAMNRCITSGRLPASCTGNALLGAFSQMLTSVLPTTDSKGPTPGPVMAGVYQGAGGWRLDFIDGGVLVNCSTLSPNQESYHLNFASDHAEIIIATRPKPLVLTLHGNDTLSAPGPVVLDGVIAAGYVAGTSTPGSTQTSSYNTTERVNANQLQPGSQGTYAGGGTYDVTTAHTTTSSTAGTSTPGYTNFAPRRVTCPALNLSTKGASTGIQTMQTDLLKGMFGGDKGAPTPPGIRMSGIFAASTGFSVQFFPESVILGCGPDTARAYPYSVSVEGAHATVHIAAPDHPLTLAFAGDHALDPGPGNYQVHGRTVVGQNDDGDFTFAPFEQSCALAVLAPATAIPSSGGTSASTVSASASNSTANPTTLATLAAPLGNAVLQITSGIPGTPSPLAGRPYLLLRDSYANTLAKAGITVPAGISPYKYAGTLCGNRSPDCQKVNDSVKAAAISATRADANGAGTLPGVPPGTYYLMISALYNGHSLVWGQAVQLKPGANTVTLDPRSATPLN